MLRALGSQPESVLNIPECLLWPYLPPLGEISLVSSSAGGHRQLRERPASSTADIFGTVLLLLVRGQGKNLVAFAAAAWMSSINSDE